MIIIAIIPARLESVRLPKKALIDILGKPMLMHVFDNIKESSRVHATYIATDSEEIATLKNDYNASILKTGPCSSGTERVFSAYRNLDVAADIIINVQGDEPLIRPKHIDKLIDAFDNPKVDIATLGAPALTQEENENHNCVKVICDEDNIAQDFTRTPVDSQANVYKHIGLYAFRTNIIDPLQKLDITPRRANERLEQLDWLLNDYAIKVVKLEDDLHSVDTPEDLKKVREILDLQNANQQD